MNAFSSRARNAATSACSSGSIWVASVDTKQRRPYRSNGGHSEQIRIAHHLDQSRTVVGERASKRVVQFRGLRDADAERAADARVLGEVRVVQLGLPDVPVAGALLLGDLAQLPVVEQDVRDRHAVL